MPEIPYTLQIETEWAGAGNDLYLSLIDVGNNHIDEIAVEVIAQTLITSDCSDQNLQIKNKGSGNWTIDVENSKITFFLNGDLVIVIKDDCLMDNVRATTHFVFANKDDISKRFRFKPSKNIL